MTLYTLHTVLFRGATCPAEYQGEHQGAEYWRVTYNGTVWYTTQVTLIGE